MREHLQKWYREWLKEHEETDLIYAGAGGKPSLHQVHFVRDTLSSIVNMGIRYEDLPKTDIGLGYEERDAGFVISEHGSKSVRLPVYLLERADLGLKFVLRNNFYDWNITVVSELPVMADLEGFATDISPREKEEGRWQRPGDYWGYCFFQGFPDDMCLGPYAMDQSRFSIWMGTDYEVYAFVRLVVQDQIRRRR